MNSFFKTIIALAFPFVFTTNADSQSTPKPYFGATPDLHVSGNEFVDPYDRPVTLHGVMDTPNAYFNGNRWCEGIPYPYYNHPGAVDAVKKYFTKIFQAIANPDNGTYCNLFRLHLDPAWTNDPNKTATNGGDENDISRFSADRLRTYLESLYIPIAQDALAHGLYVIIRPPGVFPADVAVGDAYNQYLLTVWDIVSQNEWVKEHSGQVMLELGNEPVRMTGNLADYFQPVVDKIRQNGFTGILLLPGTSYQADYRNYNTKAIVDSNFGYAVHNYPGWYGGWDANQSEANFISTFEAQVPVDKKPIVITEVDWSPMKQGAGHWNEMHTQYTEGNFGTWGTGTTNSPAPNVAYKNTQNVGWGMRFKHLVDKHENISWTLQGTTTYVDMDKFIADGTVQPAFKDQMIAAGYANASEACSGACFSWYKDYACGERLPKPYYTTTAENIGGDDRAWFDHTNNRYYFGQPNFCAFVFNGFAGTELKKCADFTIKLKDNTIGYRLDVELKKANGDPIYSSATEIYQIGKEEKGTRITNIADAKMQVFNFQSLFEDILLENPDCIIGKIRLNTVVEYGKEDTGKEGKYYIELDKMEMNVSQVTARKSTGTSLADIPMCEHAKDGNQKLLKTLTTTVKDVVFSNDAESTTIGGWGADKIDVENSVGKNNTKGYVLQNNSAKDYDYSSQFNIERAEGYTNGTEYTLKLDVKGTVAGSLGVAIQKAEGYVGCGNFPNLPITTDWQTVTLKATVNGEGANRILLNFGKYVGTIYIDNIEVYTETLKASGYEDKIGSGESVGTLYGFGSPHYANYVDISDYKSIRFEGSATDGKIRLFLNCSKTLAGTTKENNEGIDINSTYDLSSLPYAHLHSIKAGAWNTTASLSSVTLIKKSDNSEVSLSSLPYSQWEVKAEGEVVREISSFNKNFGTSVNNGEVYGVNGSVYYLDYVDLSDYTKMVIKGTGGQLRVLFNRITDGGTVKELNPSLSSGEAVIDLRKIDDKGFVHLHSIKTYQTVNVESITLINEDDPYTFADYYITGAGSHAASATSALADDKATVIDLSGFTGKWDDTFSSVNPNCILIYEDKNKIGERSDGRNLAMRENSGYSTSNISLVEDHDFRAPVDISTVNGATYTRTLTTEWATICLPFELNVTAEGSPEVYVLSSADENQGRLAFKKVSEGTVPAGSIILYRNTGKGETKLSGTGIKKTVDGFNIQPIAGVDGWYTAQSFKSQIIDDVATDPILKDYYVYGISGDKFVHATKKVTLKPFRTFYLKKKSNNAAKASLAIYISEDNETTGVNEVTIKPAPTVKEIYDSEGRLIPTMKAGLNIMRMSDGTVRKVMK